MASSLAALIAVVAIMVVIFLLCRAIVLWYWRVNEGIALLKSIDEKLGQLLVRGTAQPAPAAVRSAAVAAKVAPAAVRSAGSRNQ